MATVHDVAAYVLKKCGPLTAMKLQKLVYYSQAWSLVWDEAPLFGAPIQAWANGPVVPALYSEHKGRFKVGSWHLGKASALTEKQQSTVDAVLRFYGDKPSQWLSDLTHMEAPWREARRGVPDGERGHAVISHAALAEYYGGLASGR